MALVSIRLWRLLGRARRIEEQRGAERLSALIHHSADAIFLLSTRRADHVREPRRRGTQELVGDASFSERPSSTRSPPRADRRITSQIAQSRGDAGRRHATHRGPRGRRNAGRTSLSRAPAAISSPTRTSALDRRHATRRHDPAPARGATRATSVPRRPHRVSQTGPCSLIASPTRSSVGAPGQPRASRSSSSTSTTSRP